MNLPADFTDGPLHGQVREVHVNTHTSDPISTYLYADNGKIYKYIRMGVLCKCEECQFIPCYILQRISGTRP